MVAAMAANEKTKISGVHFQGLWVRFMTDWKTVEALRKIDRV